MRKLHTLSMANFFFELIKTMACSHNRALHVDNNGGGKYSKEKNMHLNQAISHSKTFKFL